MGDKMNESLQKYVDNIKASSTSVTEKSEILVSSTEDLLGKLEEIHNYVNEISAISSRTNILSLNASIEAARTGEAGKGFAVVAESMRSLAVSTKESSNKIFAILKNIDEDMSKMQKALKEVGDKISDSERAQVQADVDALKAALNEIPADGSATADQNQKLKDLKEKLMNSAQSVFTKMYEQAQAANNSGAQAGPDMGGFQDGNQTGRADDNVVDGDFREV